MAAGAERCRASDFATWARRHALMPVGIVPGARGSRDSPMKRLARSIPPTLW